MASLFQKHARALGFLALAQLATGPLVLGLICCLAKFAVQTTEDRSAGTAWSVSIHRAADHFRQLPDEIMRAEAALEAGSCPLQSSGKDRPAKSGKGGKSQTWTTQPWLVLRLLPRLPDGVVPIAELPPCRMEWPHAPPAPPPRQA